MTTDLWMLVGACGLDWALIMTAAVPRLLGRGGLRWGLGNRDEAAPVGAWVKRADRAHHNLQENLILFAALVLVVHVAGKTSDLSTLGTEVFFGARLAHALIYVAGIPVLRTLAWLTSLVGLAMLVAALV